MGTIAKALITLSVAVWAAGCSDPPTARVDAAKARVAALAAEAETYAPAAYAEAQQAVARTAHDHEAPYGVAIGSGPVGVGEVQPTYPDLVTVHLAGLRLGEAGVGQLGVGEGAPRHQLADDSLPGEEHVPHGTHRLVAG